MVQAAVRWPYELMGPAYDNMSAALPCAGLNGKDLTRLRPCVSGQLGDTEVRPLFSGFGVAEASIHGVPRRFVRSFAMFSMCWLCRAVNEVSGFDR